MIAIKPFPMSGQKEAGIQIATQISMARNARWLTSLQIVRISLCHLGLIVAEQRMRVCAYIAAKILKPTKGIDTIIPSSKPPSDMNARNIMGK